jgi:agmatine/peptidylarginine deiminase
LALGDYRHDPLAEKVRMLQAAWRRPAPAVSTRTKRPEIAKSSFWRRLPGEFEPQHAILLAARYLVHDQPHLFAEIAHHLGETVEVVVLVNDAEDEAAARQALRDHNVDAAPVRFLPAAHDTMWVRDYGPMVVIGPRGNPMIIDADYDADDRPTDEHVPAAVGQQWQRPVLHSGLVIEGGNLLSNGQGLFIATDRLVASNAKRGWTAATIRRQLSAVYGCRQLVLLETPNGEPNGHVDMFATFTSPNTVVVGKVDPNVDFENAIILDRNAEALSWVVTEDGPLNVVRIPMPPREAELFPTYTNVIYGNGVLLVPVYPGLDADGAREATDTYARLLKGRRIVPIDATALAEMLGGLHCISMNLGPIGKLPRGVATPEAATPAQFSADHWLDQRWSLRRFVADADNTPPR